MFARTFHNRTSFLEPESCNLSPIRRASYPKFVVRFLPSGPNVLQSSGHMPNLVLIPIRYMDHKPF